MPSRRALLRGKPPPPEVVLIEASCLEEHGVACRLCEDACDERAIRLRPLLRGRNRVILDTALCTVCGLCAQMCPVDAIRLPETAEEA